MSWGVVFGQYMRSSYVVHWRLVLFILYSPNVNPMSNVICVNYHGSSCNLYEQVRLGEKMYELHARMTH